MILVDANLLLYACDSTSAQHLKAKQWWEETVSDGEQVRLGWVTLLAFLRISTHPRAMTSPLSIDEASRLVGSWLEQPEVGVLEPGERHWEILTRLCSSAQVRGPMVMDAHLAALAIEHGAVLCTTDRDFVRFPGLKLRNPLEAKRG